MKKKIIFGIIVFILFGLSIVSAAWYAGNGMLWIAKPDDTSRFSDAGTVAGVEALTDSFTNLKWEKNPSTSAQYWQPSISHCSGKGNGWRAPTIQELVSIVTYTYKNNNNAYTAHPNIKNGVYWSSTEVYVDRSVDLDAVSTSAWYVLFNYGSTYSSTKTTYNYYVVCVHD